jgi:hypothetical protein
MRVTRSLSWALFLLPLAWTGCNEAKSPKISSQPPKKATVAGTEKPKADEGQKSQTAAESNQSEDIKANLAKLSPEDRKLAEAQKVCVVSGEPLGEMDVPVKITVKDQTVFLCCNNCKKKALADPDKTLAKLDQLKSQNKKSTN